MSYAGQCMGGPEHGNLIEADESVLIVRRTNQVFEVDGATPMLARVKEGRYRWNHHMDCWVWDHWGPWKMLHFDTPGELDKESSTG